MPKKKTGFIDKTKAVKFLLDFRDPEDPNYRNRQATDRVLKPYELLRSKKEKYDLKARNKLIRKLAEEPYQFEERVEWDESDNEKEEREARDKKRAERKAAQAGAKKPVVTSDIMEQIKGRKDLWFNELHKNDPVALPTKKLDELEIQPVPKGAKKKHVTFKEPVQEDSPKKKRDDKKGKKKAEEEEEEEWEDEEEEEEEVEEIEMDEAEWEDADGEWEDDGEEEQMKKDTKKKKHKEFKMTDKDVELDHDAVQNLQPAEGVQMKRYDENGLPMDGYDYYQHIAGDEGPEPVAVFSADYKMPVKLAVDTDMKPEDMNPDEKEIFQAMEDEDCLDEAGYDMLEDDFIRMANDGEAALVAADPKSKSKKGAKGAAKDSGNAGSGNSMGLFMNNPNVKINMKEKGALDARNLDYVMKEFDDADRPQSGPGMSNDAFDNILNEHMQGIRNRAHFEDFIIKEQKRKQKEMEEARENANTKPDRLENYFDQLKPEADKALKQHLENPSDSELSEDEMARRYMSVHDDDHTTNISLKSVNSSRVQKQLNIIKEDKTKKAKKEEEAKPVQEESDEEGEEVEDLGQKLKRSKKETKEERKARKEAVKEAKKERKEKKQTFKDTFKTMRVNSLKAAVQQNANLEGLSVYKL